MRKYFSFVPNPKRRRPFRRSKALVSGASEKPVMTRRLAQFGAVDRLVLIDKGCRSREIMVLYKRVR